MADHEMQPIAALVAPELKSRVFNAARRDFGETGRSFQADWLRAVLEIAAAASEQGRPLVTGQEMNKEPLQ